MLLILPIARSELALSFAASNQLTSMNYFPIHWIARVCMYVCVCGERMRNPPGIYSYHRFNGNSIVKKKILN